MIKPSPVQSCTNMRWFIVRNSWRQQIRSNLSIYFSRQSISLCLRCIVKCTVCANTFHQPCIHFLVVKYDYLRSLTNIHVHRRPFEPWIPGQAQETRSWRNVRHFYRAHNKQKSWLSGLLNREMNACCFKLRKYTHSLCISKYKIRVV